MKIARPQGHESEAQGLAAAAGQGIGKTTLVQQRCAAVQAQSAPSAPDRTERIHEAARRGTEPEGRRSPEALIWLDRVAGGRRRGLEAPSDNSQWLRPPYN